MEAHGEKSYMDHGNCLPLHGGLYYARQYLDDTFLWLYSAGGASLLLRLHSRDDLTPGMHVGVRCSIIFAAGAAL